MRTSWMNKRYLTRAIGKMIKMNKIKVMPINNSLNTKITSRKINPMKKYMIKKIKSKSKIPSFYHISRTIQPIKHNSPLNNLKIHPIFMKHPPRKISSLLSEPILNLLIKLTLIIPTT